MRREFCPGRTDFDADIYVDGVLKDTVAVAASSAGAFTTNGYTFAEDSGDHVVQVKVAGALVMEKTVVSDCVANPSATSTTPTLAARNFTAGPPAGVTPTVTPSLTTLAFLPADASAEEIQTEVYEIGKTGGFESLRDWFKALYETLLGTSQGPRMGSFIALYGIDNSRRLIAEALAAG